MVKLFQKLADSKGGAFGRAPQSAKLPLPLLFLLSFFSCGYTTKRKSELNAHTIQQNSRKKMREFLIF